MDLEEKAHEINGREITNHKKHCDHNLRCPKLEPADLVLVRQKAFKGKWKIQDRVEKTPYQIVEHTELDILVYRVKKKGWICKKKHVFHYNILFPLIIRDETVEQSVSEDKSVDESDHDSSSEQD